MDAHVWVVSLAVTTPGWGPRPRRPIASSNGSPGDGRAGQNVSGPVWRWPGRWSKAIGDGSPAGGRPGHGALSPSSSRRPGRARRRRRGGGHGRGRDSPAAVISACLSVVAPPPANGGARALIRDGAPSGARALSQSGYAAERACRQAQVRIHRAGYAAGPYRARCGPPHPEPRRGSRSRPYAHPAHDARGGTSRARRHRCPSASPQAARPRRPGPRISICTLWGWAPAAGPQRQGTRGHCSTAEQSPSLLGLSLSLVRGQSEAPRGRWACPTFLQGSQQNWGHLWVSPKGPRNVATPAVVSHPYTCGNGHGFERAAVDHVLGFAGQRRARRPRPAGSRATAARRPAASC